MDELKKDYEFLYASVKEFMKSAPFSEPDRFLLDFNVSIQCKNFLRKFFDYIGQNKKGSFYGIEEGKDRLRRLLDVADFNTYEGLDVFIKSIENNLTIDKRGEAKGEDRFIVEQLKREEEIISFYYFLYCLDYLKPENGIEAPSPEIHVEPKVIPKKVSKPVVTQKKTTKKPASSVKELFKIKEKVKIQKPKTLKVPTAPKPVAPQVPPPAKNKSTHELFEDMF